MVCQEVQACWFRVRACAEETSCCYRASQGQEGVVAAVVAQVEQAAAEQRFATEMNLSLGCNDILVPGCCSEDTLVCSVCSLLPTPNAFFSALLCRCPQQARASGYLPEDTAFLH